MQYISFQIFLITILILMGGYSYVYHNKFYPSIYELLENPEEHEGKIIEYKDGHIIDFHNPKNEFVYSSGKYKINVRFNGDLQPQKSLLGTTTIFGKFKNGYIELIALHNHNYNYFKYLLSIIGVAIPLFYLGKEWNLSGLKFYPRL